ncbi:MAG: hypothetical protein R2705_24065 [Ilumatobacteraceae bacterium]
MADIDEGDRHRTQRRGHDVVVEWWTPTGGRRDEVERLSVRLPELRVAARPRSVLLAPDRPHLP